MNQLRHLLPIACLVMVACKGPGSIAVPRVEPACDEYRERELASPNTDLRAKLDKHTVWLDSNEASGAMIDLSDEDLKRLNLANLHLRQGHFSRSDMSESDLSGADLQRADLLFTSLDNADLTGSNFHDANLGGAKMAHACLMRANLSGTDLRCWDYQGPSKNCAILEAADLTDADLTGARLDGANVKGVIYEPKTNPVVRGIAAAENLELLTYQKNPDALFELRKQFEQAGFRAQERQIVYAIKRRQAELATPLERWFNIVAFDWTTQYGMSPGRPIRIWLGLFAACWIAYLLFLHRQGDSGIYRIRSADSQQDIHEERLRLELYRQSGSWQWLWHVIQAEARIMYWAGIFGLMSAFNIGFRQIDLGRWLRLLPRTEYELKAKGWARTVAGWQSLLSVYLIALWALTYFGRPF